MDTIKYAIRVAMVRLKWKTGLIELGPQTALSNSLIGPLM